jgi:hypothetical protein
MEKSNLSFITLLLLFINLIGCTVTPNITDQANSANTVATSTAFAFSQNTETAYPLIAPKDIKHDTAFNGLQIAVEFSKKWNKKAFLFSIPNTAAMESNLGYPKTGLGWFYLFQNPDNPLELFVYVDNGVIQGSTEAEVASLVEVSKKSQSPLDTSGLLNSDQIMEIFYTSHTNAEKLNYQLELHFDEILKIPIWSIYKFEKGILESSPIMRINAANGQAIN